MAFAVSRWFRLSLVVVLAVGVLGSVVAMGALGHTGEGTAPQPTLQPPTNGSLDVSLVGNATVNASNGRQIVWVGSSFEVVASFQTPAEPGYKVCLWADRPTETVCKNYPYGDTDNTTTTTFSVSSWPNSTTGERNVTVEVRREDETLMRETVVVWVLEKTGSYDGDALSNVREVGGNTSAFLADTDGDGLRDGAELTNYGTDPTDPDSDNDGLTDGREVTRDTDPTAPHSDGDGLDDGREVNELDTNPNSVHSDGDNLTDGREVRELETDPNKADTDDDGLDDGRELALDTDPTVDDTDGDGVKDSREVEIGTNPRNPDTDGDTLGDGTELMLGTDPNNSLTPILLASGIIALVLVGTAFVSRTRRGAIRWRRRDGSLLPLPTFDRDTDEDAREHVDSTDREDVSRSSPDPGDDVSFGQIDTDRETILRLLQENNGRLRQGQIVDQTDWSASKVSRVLSKMEEDKQVSKVTIGRENIVTIYGEEPNALPNEET